MAEEAGFGHTLGLEFRQLSVSRSRAISVAGAAANFAGNAASFNPQERVSVHTGRIIREEEL